MRRYLRALSAAAALSLIMIMAVSASHMVVQSAVTQSDTLYEATILRDSVPVTTVVPVQRGDVVVNDTVSADSLKHHLTHAERRALRAKEFAAKVDSLVESLTFSFRPTTMQAMPNGELRMVYADYYYLLVSPMALEVHLPLERVLSQIISVLNFDNDGVEGLKPEKYGTRWMLSFTAEYYGEAYEFGFTISTLTGEVLLTLQSPNYSMRYVGEILSNE